MTVPALPSALHATLHGPLPTCTSGNTGVLTPGVITAAGSPAEPAPPAWDNLQARLIVAPTVHEGPIPLSIMLINRGRKPVSLSAPCPSYAITTSGTSITGRGLAGGTFIDADSGDLCGDGPLEVPAGRSVTLRAGTTPYEREGPWKKGSTLSIDWAIAGVPTAHATTTVN